MYPVTSITAVAGESERAKARDSIIERADQNRSRAIYAAAISSFITECRRRHNLTERALARRLHQRFSEEWPRSVEWFVRIIRRVESAGLHMQLTHFIWVAMSLDEHPVAAYAVVLSRVEDRRQRELQTLPQ